MTRTSSRAVSSWSTDAKIRLLAALLSVVVGGAWPSAIASAAEEAAGAAPDIAKLWQKNCQSCHGPDGKGKTKAGEKAKVRDLTSPEVKAKLDRAKIVAGIKDGIKDESGKEVMKSYAEKLSPVEIEALADHSMKF